MKPKTGVYLSVSLTARLAAAATITGATKSALVEAALDRFLTSDSAAENAAALTGRLTELGDQIERLGSDLKLVNEVVALHARFHLAVTPSLSATEQHIASAVGATRFEEFAAQVARRLELGTSLVGETMSRRTETNEDRFAGDVSANEQKQTNATLSESDLRSSTQGDFASEPIAAAREDGSIWNFPKRTRGPVPQKMR